MRRILNLLLVLQLNRFWRRRMRASHDELLSQIGLTEAEMLLITALRHVR